MATDFLPVSQSDLQRRGWDRLDIILITGDAYVDHPAYGVALIGRALEAHGFRVGVIAQPDWRTDADFKRLGKPRLFFGITSGNVDSMVANYTANKRPRKKDDYTPGGKAGMRPDRALLVYANRVRQAFKDAVVVIGGIEASMRRLAHYDYWDNRVRRSILFDARADMLVYGMGESQTVEIARRLDAGEGIDTLDGIPGTAVIRKDPTFLKETVVLPAFEAVADDPAAFNKAFALFYGQQNPHTAQPVVQAHGDRFAVVYPPPMPLAAADLDAIYERGYCRSWHPDYEAAGGGAGAGDGAPQSGHPPRMLRGVQFLLALFPPGAHGAEPQRRFRCPRGPSTGRRPFFPRHDHRHGRAHGQSIRGRLPALGQEGVLRRQTLPGPANLFRARSRLRA